MKLKDGFVIRSVAGETVVLPAEGTLNFNGMITLNDTAAFLWKLLEKDTDEAAMTAALLEAYEVEEAVAEAHVKAFVKDLKEKDFLD